MLRSVLAGGLLIAALCAGADARTLRIASANDPQSMDPHALSLQYQSRVVTQIYEGLVNRSRDFKLEPSLAESWERTAPLAWRFRLRAGVSFHDGTPFTADDAVFSIERAMSRTSQRANQLRGIAGVKKLDAGSIEIRTAETDAVLPEKLWLVAMMSKAWSEKNRVTQPQDYNARQETFAVRHANGTGPFMLERYEADARTVLKANPRWWGRGTPFGGGNLDEAVFVVIQSDATRLAALASKQVDLVLDPPLQDLPRLKADPSIKLVSTADIGTQYLALDQHRAELPDSGVSGRNPFKDRRVRLAVWQAIDTDLIVRQVLRGQGVSTGSAVSPLVEGHVAALDARPPYDPAAARALLKEAGFGAGFRVTLDCLSVASRAAACQAIAAMLERVGIKVNFQPAPAATFFPKVTQAISSFMEFGWAPGTDAWFVLNTLLRTNDGMFSGAFNGGRYANPKYDALIDAVRVEPDLARRRTLVGEVLRLIRDDVAIIPLYRRQHTWAMRPDVELVQWSNDVAELRWARVR
ncbi:MAG: ABC transporter substrate-binding protein [Piscinibacter sp.]|nr:ABC transporter substrate-binding protein [Piscinibacter sp.]